MFEKFGEFDSASEINRKAEELFNAGDFEGIRALAEENRIPSEYADAYCDGELPELCDRLTAAIGKLELEEQEIVMVGVMEDWLHYILPRRHSALVLNEPEESGQRCHGVYGEANKGPGYQPAEIRNRTKISAVYKDRDP